VHLILDYVSGSILDDLSDEEELLNVRKSSDPSDYGPTTVRTPPAAANLLLPRYIRESDTRTRGIAEPTFRSVFPSMRDVLPSHIYFKKDEWPSIINLGRSPHLRCHHQEVQEVQEKKLEEVQKKNS